MTASGLDRQREKIKTIPTVAKTNSAALGKHTSPNLMIHEQALNNCFDRPLRKMVRRVKRKTKTQFNNRLRKIIWPCLRFRTH
jgi:hypothetical protein